jgi:hypothetical protein
MAQSQPPITGTPPQSAVSLLPPLQPEPAPSPGITRQLLAVLLSLCLVLFLADAAISLVDDSLGLWFGLHFLKAVRGMVALIVLCLSVVIYGLMGLTPMVPKRLFLPFALFNPISLLLYLLLAIYFYGRHERIVWVLSFCQVVLSLGLLRWALGGSRIRWPLVEERWLGSRGFSWLNLSGFLLLNIFVLLPAVALYLFVCAALAVDHFSEGFLALRPSGLTVQVRNYLRHDGKKVRLVPMAHVGEAEFYQKVSQSFPTNSLVLMEGVTDENNLLTNKVTYKRMASSLGLAEQHEAFNPVQVEMVMADIDIRELTADTIGFLNLVMLFHAKGITADTVLKVLRFTPPPGFEERLWDDLLRKRNQHLLGELRSRLSDSEVLIVPWGVAHMPGIAEGIRAAGFRLDGTQDFAVIRFGKAPQSPLKATSKRQ